MQDIVELPADDLRRGLTHLQGAEFLYESRLFPEPEYTFKHALTHDVAYESLLHDNRRQLHRQVGLAIEAHYANRLMEFAETLASHFERGEDRCKAVSYYLQATEKVKTQHAYQSAIQFCTRALDLAGHVSQLVETRVQGHVLLGDLWGLLGGVERANHNYDQAIQMSPDIATRQHIANKRHRPHMAVRNGAKIAYDERGSGDTLLVFASPSAYNPESFQPLVENLCQEFCVVTVESRGSGASDPRPESYSLQQHAEDMRAVIEACSASGPIVGVGLSLWSPMLVKLAAAYPTLLHKLVLVSSNAAFNELNATQAWLAEYRKLLEQGHKEQAMRLVFSVQYPEPEAGLLVEQMVRGSLSTPIDILLHHFDPDPEYDVTPLPPQIPVPTLLMQGAVDQRTPLDSARRTATHIPNAKLYAFKDKGHGLIRTATMEFCEVLRCFVRTGGIPTTGNVEEASS